MNIDWKLVGTALGLVLLIEGMPYFLFAEKMPETLRALSRLSPKVLRILGGAAMAAGLCLMWLMKKT